MSSNTRLLPRALCSISGVAPQGVMCRDEGSAALQGQRQESLVFIWGHQRVSWEALRGTFGDVGPTCLNILCKFQSNIDPHDYPPASWSHLFRTTRLQDDMQEKRASRQGGCWGEKRGCPAVLVHLSLLREVTCVGGFKQPRSPHASPESGIHTLRGTQGCPTWEGPGGRFQAG